MGKNVFIFEKSVIKNWMQISQMRVLSIFHKKKNTIWIFDTDCFFISFDKS